MRKGESRGDKFAAGQKGEEEAEKEGGNDNARVGVRRKCRWRGVKRNR